MARDSSNSILSPSTGSKNDILPTIICIPDSFHFSNFYRRDLTRTNKDKDTINNASFHTTEECNRDNFETQKKERT